MSGHSARRAYFSYRALASILSGLPAPLARGVAGRAARLYAKWKPDKLAIVEQNLERVLGARTAPQQLRTSALEVFASYGRYWSDVARLSPRRARPYVAGFEAPDNLEDLLQRRDNGLILALPHLGIWEVGGLYLQSLGIPLTSVAEESPSPRLARYFARRRHVLGITTVPPDEHAYGSLVSVLRDGGVVALVADRDLEGGGVAVQLFGEATSLPAGPSVLALRSGAVLVPCAVYRRGGSRTEAVLGEAIDTKRRGTFREDVARVTNDLARSLERLIAAEPEQWLVLSPIWGRVRAPGPGS